jgi:hypothetical protein
MIDRFLVLSSFMESVLCREGGPHSSLFQTRSGTDRTSAAAARWHGLPAKVRDPDWIAELRLFRDTFSYAKHVLDAFQSDTGSLSDVPARIAQLTGKLSSDVRTALQLDGRYELSTWTCLSRRALMTPSVAYKAALLFQVSRRFFSRLEDRVECPAVTEYNGPDPARHGPPPGWEPCEDDRAHPTATRGRRAATACASAAAASAAVWIWRA